MKDRPLSKVSDLDQTERFLRKGKTFFDPSKIIVDVNVRIRINPRNPWSIDGSIFDIAPFHRNHFEKAYWDDDDKTKDEIWQNMKTTKVIVQPNSFYIMLRKHGDSKFHNWSTSGVVVFDYRNKRIDTGKKDADNNPVMITVAAPYYRRSVPKSIITAPELRRLRKITNLLELFKFCREIRKRCRRLLNANKFTGITQCDYLKTLKGHDELLAGIKTQMSILETAVQPFKDAYADRVEELIPLFKIPPYDNLRNTLDSINNHVERLLEDIEEIKEEYK